MKYELDPLPLTDDDFARIRANVMAKVTRPPRLLVWRWALAPIVIALIGLSLGRNDAVPWPALPPASRLAPRPVYQPVWSSALVAEPAPRIRPSVRKRVPPAAPETQPEIRIEIRTSDPDVRIIWIANQAKPSEEESSL